MVYSKNVKASFLGFLIWILYFYTGSPVMLPETWKGTQACMGTMNLEFEEFRFMAQFRKAEQPTVCLYCSLIYCFLTGQTLHRRSTHSAHRKDGRGDSTHI